jgi:arginyl-tRNA synthetase
VTGSEQSEYFKVLYAALREVFGLGEEKELVHIPTGFLTLTTGKMSSRKGNVLTGESMLEELESESKKRAEESRTDDIDELGKAVAVAALKYQILRHSIGSDIIFDKEKALSFEGDSGPYLQYTHARIVSVLKKAEGVGVIASIENTPEIPYELERIVYRFEEVTREAAEMCEPHLLITYLTQLAGAFNSFYAKESIADATDEFAPYKAALTSAVGITLSRGLNVLGMKAPLQM